MGRAHHFLFIMTVTTLVQSTKPEWAKTTSGWFLADRFAFFVFQVKMDYCAGNYFAGLDAQMVEDGYYVGGTLAHWDKVCYASLSNNELNEDCHDIYRRVYEVITGMGYPMSGKRNTSHRRFLLS